MGRLYPAGLAIQTVGRQGGAMGMPYPKPPQIPPIKPYPIGVEEWPKLPTPANDNVPPGTGRGAKKPPIRVPSRPAIGRGLNAFVVWSAIGVVPGWQGVAIPTFMGRGYFSKCPKPNGFGPIQSSPLSYFPLGFSGSSPHWQSNACLDSQALPGGDDGFPDPGPSADNAIGYYRYTNVAQSRYTHLWSVRGNVRVGELAQPYVPGTRTAGNAAPLGPPPPSPPKGKEKKFIIKGPLASVLSGVTEVGDFVDCAFSSLPKSTRAAAYSSMGGRLGKGAKAAAVYDAFHEMDMTALAACMFANAVEDAVWGTVGKYTGIANRRRGNLAGLTVGPAL